LCTSNHNTCLEPPYSNYYTAQVPDAKLLVEIGKFPHGTQYIFTTPLLGWNSATSTNEGFYQVGATATEQVSDVTLGAPAYSFAGNAYTCLSFKVNASGTMVYVQRQSGLWWQVPNSCM
jgi:hypothetical protein